MQGPPRRAAAAAVVITVVLVVMTVGYTSLGQMACDSCTGTELTEFESWYWTAVSVVAVGVVLGAALLVASLLTRRRTGIVPTILTWLAPALVALAGVIAVVLIET